MNKTCETCKYERTPPKSPPCIYCHKNTYVDKIDNWEPKEREQLPEYMKEYHNEPKPPTYEEMEAMTDDEIDEYHRKEIEQ